MPVSDTWKPLNFLLLERTIRHKKLDKIQTKKPTLTGLLLRPQRSLFQDLYCLVIWKIEAVMSWLLNNISPRPLQRYQKLQCQNLWHVAPPLCVAVELPVFNIFVAVYFILTDEAWSSTCTFLYLFK